MKHEERGGFDIEKNKNIPMKTLISLKATTVNYDKHALKC
jgi:hypothetical protein